MLAECFLGAVSHVQEPIFFLESSVQRVHATGCTYIVNRNLWISDLKETKKKYLERALQYRWFLPVWGSVFCTKTKRAFDGSNCSLLLSMWMKCPTVMSRGTKYLRKSKYHHSFSINCWTHSFFLLPNIKSEVTTYLFFSMSGRSAFEYFSMITCDSWMQITRLTRIKRLGLRKKNVDSIIILLIIIDQNSSYQFCFHLNINCKQIGKKKRKKVDYIQTSMISRQIPKSGIFF